MAPTDPKDLLPDVRDGLTRRQRIVLTTLSELQREWGDRPVPTAVVYGHVVEKLPISPAELQEILGGLTGGD